MYSKLSVACESTLFMPLPSQLRLSRAHLAPQSGAINWVSSPLERLVGLNFSHTGKCCSSAKGCMGIWPWPHSLAFTSAEKQMASWLVIFPRGDRAQRQQNCDWCVSVLSRKLGLPPSMVGRFHIIFHQVTVFWECPNSFKMAFLCGLMFLICYNLYYVSTCLNHRPDGIHSGQTLRQLLFRG